MTKPFFERLKRYYSEVGAVLRGEAGVASIFPNTSDIGATREQVYAEFLRAHLPSACNIFFGGFTFDLLVTNDSCPQFNFTNPDGREKHLHASMVYLLSRRLNLRWTLLNL